jgi:hypothetical protein
MHQIRNGNLRYDAFAPGIHSLALGLSERKAKLASSPDFHYEFLRPPGVAGNSWDVAI